MSPFKLMTLSWRSLMSNKTRSFLTMLGVIIGVASVVAMVAIGEGAKKSVEEAVSAIGKGGYFYVRSGSASSSGMSWGAGSVNTLLIEDGWAVLEECDLVVAASPMIEKQVQIIYGDKNHSPDDMEGVSASFQHIKDWPAIKGSWFDEEDERNGAKVCLLGQSIVDKLFPYENPVNKVIRIGRVRMLVTGVLEKRGTGLWGNDQDDTVIMPYTTMRRFFATKKSHANSVKRLIFKALSPQLMPQAKEQVADLLRFRHKMKPGEANDFRVYDLSRYTERYTETSRQMSLLLSIIASISLLVGGIGIMNIMLVSVTERISEIGVRMAVGARGSHILSQFLVEAVVLSAIGGVLGVALGIGVSETVTYYLRWPTILNADIMILAFVVSMAIGMIFGFYPSWRASRLDPIQCLRSEG